MARFILSAGMLLCFASAMIVRRRGCMSGSPPPARAATVSSLMSRVKILPRFASAAPFLCLMECHLEWPDISQLPESKSENAKILHPFREDDPHAGARIPGAPAIIAQERRDGETGALQLARHLRHGQRAECQREPM